MEDGKTDGTEAEGNDDDDDDDDDDPLVNMEEILPARSLYPQPVRSQEYLARVMVPVLQKLLDSVPRCPKIPKRLLSPWAGASTRECLPDCMSADRPTGPLISSTISSPWLTTCSRVAGSTRASPRAMTSAFGQSFLTFSRTTRTRAAANLGASL